MFILMNLTSESLRTTKNKTLNNRPIYQFLLRIFALPLHYLNLRHFKVVSMRRKRVTFSPLDFMSPDTWKPSGQASKIFQRSKFQGSDGAPGKENSMILLKGDLFPNKKLFSDPEAHKNPALLTEPMKDAAKWAIKNKMANTIALFSSGRSRKINRWFEELVENEVADESRRFYGDVLFKCPDKDDPRFHRRRIFGGLKNQESLVGMLPVANVRMFSKSRTHYNACGEKSTYASTYSKVGLRPWSRLPKLTLEDKKTIVAGVGCTALPQYGEQDSHALQPGHPLFLNELWELEMHLQLFQDMNVTHVFDLTPGSGAAAMAAAILRIQYEGLGMNKDHCDWLDKILDKAMFAIIASAKDEESLKIKNEVCQYFNAIVEEARGLLSSEPADGYGDDEEDEDEVNECEDDGEK